MLIVACLNNACDLGHPDSADRRDASLVPTHVPLNTVNQRREHVSASADRSVCRTRCQAAADRSSHANVTGVTLAIIQKANAICERVIGTIRRECLDWLIPPSESHLRSTLRMWIPHYNAGRPHMELGPGIPDPPPTYRDQSQPNSRHRSGESYAVGAKSFLGGLHHEYFLAPACA